MCTVSFSITQSLCSGLIHPDTSSPSDVRLLKAMNHLIWRNTSGSTHITICRSDAWERQALSGHPGCSLPHTTVLTLLVSSRGAVSCSVLRPHGGMFITGQKAECPSLGIVCAQHVAGQAGSLLSRGGQERLQILISITASPSCVLDP